MLPSSGFSVAHYGVAYLMILAQEQSGKLLMHCHVYGSLDLPTCLCSKKGHLPIPKHCTSVAYLGSLSISEYFKMLIFQF